MNIPFLFIGTTEIVVILLVVLLLFGGKKIPELMNGIGKGVKSFKDGMNGKDVVDNENKTSYENENQKVNENENQNEKK
jgi:sec-independent protein translocase protein TatA